MPQSPHVKWWNRISKKLGKAQRKALHKRKVLQPGSIICPHALWKNAALQLQKRLCFPMWPAIFPNNSDHSHHNGAVGLMACGSAPGHSKFLIQTPFPLTTGLGNISIPTSAPCSRSCLCCSPWLHPGYSGERMWWEEEGQRLQESWGEFEGDLVPVAAFRGPVS